MGRPLTRGQRKAHLANKAKGLMHWNRARQLSAEGVEKADAAQRLGLTVKGLNSLLYRNARSQRWPIAEEYHL